MKNRTFLQIIIAAAILISIAGCHRWDNFTTYFNTYYNANRLLKESENEFEFIDEKKRVKPRTLVPEPKIFPPSMQKSGTPPFMQDYVISNPKRQPVETKLDSIIIKCSKILAKHPKSDYIERSLFLLAKTYFYKNEWGSSQIKCSEMIDRYPEGELSPDAHLLLAKNYLVQQKFEPAKLLLSRTVDICWFKKRYDLLSEAFRLQAEVALFENNTEKALQPYKQAVAQTDDNSLRAKWQFELAALLFRLGKFERAEKEFLKVHNYNPDFLTEFEANLYRAACLARIGQFEQSEKMLSKLESNRNNEEWLGWIYAERLNLSYLREYTLKSKFEKENPDSSYISTKKSDIQALEKYSDSAYVGNPSISAAYFLKGMQLFKDFQYKEAKNAFSKSRTITSPINKTADKLYNLLTAYEQKKSFAIPKLREYYEKKDLPEDMRSQLALSLFELGRINEQLGLRDSSHFYYKSAIEVAPTKDPRSARIYFAYSRIIADSLPRLSDSLLEYVVEKYPLTEYGKEAMKILGFTSEFVIDTVKELYFSGNQLRKAGNYNFALRQYIKVYTTYPTSEYAPKALYSIGWIFENNLHEQECALFYYKLLSELYPHSPYAKDVQLSMQYLTALLKNEELPEQLLPKEVKAYVPNNSQLEIAQPGVQPDKKDKLKKPVLPRPKNATIKSDDILKNPNSFLDDMKEKFKNPFGSDEIDNLKDSVNAYKNVIDDPSSILNSFNINNTKAKDAINDPTKLLHLTPADSSRSKTDSLRREFKQDSTNINSKIPKK
ncbi:MAG: hypothetical protein HW421_3775 [Ignavibacteria bacterium]|nr:hypothetical protein [Ignavibacteria bacterium]